MKYLKQNKDKAAEVTTQLLFIKFANYKYAV